MFIDKLPELINTENKKKKYFKLLKHKLTTERIINYIKERFPNEEIDIKIVEQILENRNNDKDTRTKHVITQCYISAKETKELFENK